MASYSTPRITLVDCARACHRMSAASYVLALLIAATPAGAQLPTVTSCQSTSKLIKPTKTLSLELLDYLETVSSSPFVHAFLLSHVAATGDEKQGLTACARNFLKAPPDDVATLTANFVTAGTYIAALREAEQERLLYEDVRARVPTLATGVASIRERPDEAASEVYTHLLSQADSASCRGGVSDLCTALGRARVRINSLKKAQVEASASKAAWESISSRLSLAVRDQPLRRVTEEEDLAALTRIRIALADTMPDSARQSLLADSTRARERLNDIRLLNVGIDSLSDSARMAEVAMTAGATAATTAADDVRTALNALHEELQRQRAVRIPGLALPDRQQVRTRLAFAPPTPVASSQVPRERAANVLMELTDFVIDRAKQEIVLSYLTTLYRTMQDEPLLQNAFPNTHQLMRGLTGKDATRLSAVAAGRISLNVWRSTLKNDFHSLPINLLRAPDSLICDTVVSCFARVAELRPIAVLVERLVQGRPVLEVIREAPYIASQAGAGRVDYSKPFIQGLQFLAAVAETYQVQGLALTADPFQHPYILSMSTLRVGNQEQLKAFVRLLVLRIVPDSRMAFDVDSIALTDAARRATEAVESIATAINSTEPATEYARQVLGSAVAALRAADGVAMLFRPESAASSLPGIRQFFFDVAEPLVVRDYSLAMARTAVLLREVKGGTVSSNLLTLASLASSLADSRSGADVRAALETASSPVGGWQAKRYREGPRTTISAFPGVALGGEWLIDGPYSLAAGVALPIGPEYQLVRRSLSSSDTPGCFVRIFCSAGVFVPVIDLGTLLSYRLKSSDTVNSEPNTGFRQVFAPGAYLNLGLGRTAFALLLGGQFMPGIREVTEGSEISGNAWRLGGALTIDVMLFSF